MELQQIDIELLIPQKKPFIMVDKLLEISEKTCRCSFTINADNVMLNQNVFCEEGMLENMAQASAAHLGYWAYLKNQEPPVGFIAAVKNLRIIDSAKIGDTITTYIEYSNTILNIHIINAITSLNGTKIASAELRIFIKE